MLPAQHPAVFTGTASCPVAIPGLAALTPTRAGVPGSGRGTQPLPGPRVVPKSPVAAAQVSVAAPRLPGYSTMRWSLT